jgi:hypothetical protein
MADRFYRVALQSTVHGQQIVNTLHFFGDDAALDFTPLTAQGLADKLGSTTSFTTTYGALIAVSGTFDDIVVTQMLAVGDTAVPEYGLHHVGITGGLSDGVNPVPDPLCGVLTLKTGVPRRGASGRMFLPPLCVQSNMTDELLAAGYKINVQNFVDELGHWNKNGSRWATSGSSSWGIGVYSKTRRDRGEPNFAYHVVGYRINNAVTWLRSRRLAKA